MKILVFSDSHGHTVPMQRALIKYQGRYDYVFHLGDCCEDTKYIEKHIGPMPSLYVAGNNDFTFSGNRDKFPYERTVELGGKKIFMCHGHLLRVKYNMETLYSHVCAAGCSVALFGHTHSPVSKEMNGILLCNPGSIGVPNANRLTFGMLTLDDSRINFEILEAE